MIIGSQYNAVEAGRYGYRVDLADGQFSCGSRTGLYKLSQTP